MNLSSENSITPSSKRGWESMRVGRREFAWVFPQLSLVGETSSESWMRVDENLFSLSDYLVFSRCLHVSFSSLFDACQTVDSPSHYSNCHLSMIRNNIFFFSYSSYGQWLGNRLLLQLSIRLSCNSHHRSNERNLSLTLIKIWTSSKLTSAWECMRFDESWRSNESESCDSHPLSSSPLDLQLEKRVRKNSLPVSVFFSFPRYPRQCFENANICISPTFQETVGSHLKEAPYSLLKSRKHRFQIQNLVHWYFVRRMNLTVWYITAFWEWEFLKMGLTDVFF